MTRLTNGDSRHSVSIRHGGPHVAHGTANATDCEQRLNGPSLSLVISLGIVNAAVLVLQLVWNMVSKTVYILRVSLPVRFWIPYRIRNIRPAVIKIAIFRRACSDYSQLKMLKSEKPFSKR